MSYAALLPTGLNERSRITKRKANTFIVKIVHEQQRSDRTGAQNCVHTEHTAGGFKETKAALCKAPLSGLCNRSNDQPDSCSHEEPYAIKYHNTID